MEILKFPHPDLFVKCAPVTVFGPELKVLLNSMQETMVEKNGVGLAANQVGLLYRMFVMMSSTAKILHIVNPKILRKSVGPANMREGCLSAPGEFLVLSERAEWVEIEYQDSDGTIQRGYFKGIFAVCVQHEIDHLDGKSHLQAESIPRSQRKLLAKKWGIK